MNPEKSAAPETQGAHRRKPWRQVTLRALLVLVALLQIPLVWFYYKGRAVQRERDALESLAGSSDAGWRAPDHFDPVSGLWQVGQRTAFQERMASLGLEGYFYPVRHLGVEERHYGDSLAENLSQVPHLSTLQLFDCRFDDTARFPETGLRHLQSLHLARAELPAGLIHSLKKCDQLETLMLRGCTLDRDAQAALAELVQIKRLHLNEAMLPQADWSFMPSLTNLERLSIDKSRGGPFAIANVPSSVQHLQARGCEISVEGLASDPSHALEQLQLERCKLSKDEIAAILRAFPRLKSVEISKIGTTAPERDALKAEFPHVGLRW